MVFINPSVSKFLCDLDSRNHIIYVGLINCSLKARKIRTEGGKISQKGT